MKRILISLGLVLLLAGNVFAAGSACNELFTPNINLKYGDNYFPSGIKIVRFGCVADDGNGSYPSTAFSAGTMSELIGWSLYMGATINGTPAPTALYKVAITDTDGVDILGNGGANRPGTAAVSSQFMPLTDSVGAAQGWRPITTNLTLALTDNLVNSAITTVLLYFFKTN